MPFLDFDDSDFSTSGGVVDAEQLRQAWFARHPFPATTGDVRIISTPVFEPGDSPRARLETNIALTGTDITDVTADVTAHDASGPSDGVTSGATRPFADAGIRQNYLLHSEDFSNAIWTDTLGNTTVTANFARGSRDPIGTTTADRLTWDTVGLGLRQSALGLTSGNRYTLRFFARWIGGTNDTIAFDLRDNGSQSVQISSAAIREYSVTLEAGTGGDFLDFVQFVTTGDFIFDGIWLSDEDTNHEHPYAKTTDTQLLTPASGFVAANIEARDTLTLNGNRTQTNPSATFEIYRAEDLEALATAGVVTLTEDTAILLKADIAVDVKFDLGGFQLVFPSGPTRRNFTYTGTGDFISGAGIVDFFILNTFLNFTGATLVNITAGSLGFSGLFANGLVSVGWGSLGSVVGGIFILENSAFVSWGAGFTASNNGSFQVISSLVSNGPSSGSFITATNTLETQLNAIITRTNLVGGSGTVTLLNIDAAFAPTSQASVVQCLASGGSGIFDTTGATGTFTAVADAAVASTTIDSVSDSSGVARFNFTVGPTLFVDQEVVITGFITNTAYNVTGFITATGAGFFEIATVDFGTDEASGSFTSASVTLTDTATTLVDGDTLTLDTDLADDYDGGATVYNQLTNSVQVNRTFTQTESGTWDTGGLDQTDKRVTAFNQQQSANSQQIGSLVVVANSTVTTISTINTWTDLNLNALAVEGSNIERWKLVDATTGELLFTGIAEFRGELLATASVTSSGGTQTFQLRAVDQDGNPFTDGSVQSRDLSAAPMVGFELIVPIIRDSGQSVRLQVQNTSGTSDILFQDISIEVQ